MADKPKKRKKDRQTYRHKQNAVHVTLYDQHGEALPPGVRHAAEDLFLNLAIENNLLINIALT